MYMGAGLNWSNDKIKERAIKDLRTLCKTYLWPPLNSVRLCFQTPPSATLTSSPSLISCPSGGSNLAEFPGRRSPKMAPKSLT